MIQLFWLKHTHNSIILSEFKEVCGEDVILLRAAFDGGPTELVDLPGPGDLVTLGRTTLAVR
jgi:hypothetical protein